MSNKRAHPDARLLDAGLYGKVDVPQATHRSPGPAVRKRPASTPPDQLTKLRARLKTAEETLRAIQSGEVDALMVSGPRGEQVVSLQGGEPSYRMLVEAMSEGAATLSRDGAVLYCNRRFRELIGRPPGKIVGIAVQSLVAKTDRDRFEVLLADAQKAVVKGEFNLRCTNGLIPVYLSLNPFRGYKGHALGMVITDLSEQKRIQVAEIKQAEAMHRLLLEHTLSAQEEERRRIARELHDEAGQLLTALLVGLRTLEDARKLADVKVQGRRLREIAAQAIDEVGRLARGLHPTVLDDHGLDVALSRYASEYTKTHNIDVDLNLNEAELAKAIHKEVDPGSCGADHLRQGLLRDLGNQGFGLAGLAKFRHQKQNPGQTFFAGVEELIDKIGLNAHAARQQKLHEEVQEGMLFMHDANHLVSSNLERQA